MSDLLQKIRNFYKKIRTSNRSYSKDSIRPSHDWNILILFTTFGFLSLALLAFFFYKKVDQGEFFIVEKKESQKEVKINSMILERVVKDINLREEKRVKIEEGKVVKPDPSL